jgi:hypothetical protein
LLYPHILNVLTPLVHQLFRSIRLFWFKTFTECTYFWHGELNWYGPCGCQNYQCFYRTFIQRPLKNERNEILRSYVLFMLFVFVGVYISCCWTRLVSMSNMAERLIRGRNCLPFASTWIHSRFLVRSVLLIFVVFCCCVVFLCFICLRTASCVPNHASVSDFPFLIAPSDFANVYLICKFRFAT